MRAQSLLHPVCAQQLDGYDVGGSSLPTCHAIARVCNNNPECRDRLEKYNQACSVDAKTMTCAGPPEACRRGMIDILGTELRTNCGCEGTAADFRELYDCIGWHRSLWVNPCVGECLNFQWKKSSWMDFLQSNLLFSVEAQKDYHRIRGNLLPDDNDRTTKPMKGGGGRGGFGYTPVYTEPPPIKTLPPSPDPPKWTQPPINPWTQPPPDPYTEAQPDPWDPGRWPTTSDREFGEYLPETLAWPI